MKKEEKERYWSKKVAEYTRSGKTKEEWCLKKNISLKQFSYWLKQFSKEPTGTQWLPVKIKEDNKHLTVAVLNIKIGEISIEVSTGFDKELLAEVLNTLKSL